MPSLGLASSLSKGIGALSSYERDGLKLYMPYNSPKEVKFVGEGSTAFDGSGDYITVSSVSAHDFTSDFTVSAWIKADSGSDTYDAIIGKYDSSKGWDLILNAGKLRMAARGSASIDTDGNDGNDLRENKWHHVSATVNESANTIILYVDGEIITTHTGETWTPTTTSNNLTIGARGTSYPFNGSIKNVAVWSRVLSSTEIQNVMHKTYADLSGTLSSGLVSWWALESDYVDIKGGYNGSSSGDPTFNTSLYGGATPLIPRGFDNAPTVQADAIGTGFALFGGDTSNDKIVVADNSTLDIADAISISVWIKPTVTSTYKGIIDKGVMGDNLGDYGMYLSNANPPVLHFFLNGASKVTTTDTITINKWSHIACTYDRTAGGTTEAKVYIDGVLSKEGDFSTAIATSSTVLNIGQYYTDNAYEFAGNIKNVGIWSSALTQAEIQSIMEKTYSELIASEKTNLVSWWGLDTNADDEHGDNDGTLT